MQADSLPASYMGSPIYVYVYVCVYIYIYILVIGAFHFPFPLPPLNTVRIYACLHACTHTHTHTHTHKTHGSTLLTHAFARDSQTLTGRFGSVSCGVTAPLPWVLVCTRSCLCLQKSLFPPVLWKSCNEIPVICKVRFLGESQSPCQIPSLGSLMWGLEPLQQGKNFFV